MKDITFVIQGPANPISIKNINNLLNFGNVIISCYEKDNIEKFNISSEVKIIKNSFPENHPFLHPLINSQNGFLQAYTTLSGLKNVETEFAIKMRGDESFEDFSFFISKMKENPEKYTTVNFFFRKDSYCKFHPCDHLFGSKTELLKKTFEILFYKNIKIVNIPIECKIFLSFLEAKKILLDFEKSKELTKENSQIVNLRKMKNFTLSVNCKNNYKNPIKYNESQIELIENDESTINANTIEEI
jgi:hypothetical protein